MEIHPAASVAILLDEVNRKGMLKKGDKLMLAGFGSWTDMGNHGHRVGNLNSCLSHLHNGTSSVTNV